MSDVHARGIAPADHLTVAVVTRGKNDINTVRWKTENTLTFIHVFRTAMTLNAVDATLGNHMGSVIGLVW